MKFLSILWIFVLTGCMGAFQRGGQTTISSGSDFRAGVTQPENPNQSASLNVNRTVEDGFVAPAGTVITTVDFMPNAKGVAIPVKSNSIVLSKDTPMKKVVNEKITTDTGSSWKDTAREIKAKLGSLRWISIVGMVVLLFGVASMAYPPLRALVNSVTFSAMCIAVGLGLIVLPTMIVGHELLIFGVGGGVLLLWFFVHRHAEHKTIATKLRNYFDR